ncbi:FecR family protein [Pedobacter deserti]|uniref:FecR family protein n=1 Tax=Pedobacter deserti TaxID=2817382 RepID=UPI00210968A4|nr:FecR domain-containing protein [Pedobacter sp. SYSU D00382]
MDQKEIDLLLEKYRNGYASDDEVARLNRWYRNIAYQDAIYPEAEDQVKDRVHARLMSSIRPARSPRLFRYVATVAAMFAIVLGGYMLVKESPDSSAKLLEAGALIKPGSGKAVLILGNGERIALSDTTEGDLGVQNGTDMIRAVNGQVIYTDQPGVGKEGREPSPFNMLSVPRGGQYRLQLPDGTRVWLNAATTLKYRASFKGLKERLVELDGEAYFEVAKDAAHPFIVKARGQQIRVLGTHFNVSSYADETVAKTTLLEGSVNVEPAASAVQPVVLKPGQQALLFAHRLQVSQADIDQAIAWKNLLFVFDHDDLQSIMKKVSRWYDVEIVYQDDDVKQEVFSGRISKFKHVAELLNKLSLTGAVKFKIEGRRILVMK